FKFAFPVLIILFKVSGSTHPPDAGVNCVWSLSKLCSEEDSWEDHKSSAGQALKPEEEEEERGKLLALWFAAGRTGGADGGRVSSWRRRPVVKRLVVNCIWDWG
ncbi:hypothetical protein EJB05_27298, partial [Eragrostis curvula]